MGNFSAGDREVVLQTWKYSARGNLLFGGPATGVAKEAIDANDITKVVKS